MFEASMKFKEVVKGKNIMTPNIISYEEFGDYVVELSKGIGMNGEDLYGVTVVNVENKEHCH